MTSTARLERLTRRVELRPRIEAPVIDYPAYRRGPGGLVLAVLYLVGDGYDTSLKLAHMLETSLDNINGALGRLEHGLHTQRSSPWGQSPVFWAITESGRSYLRAQLWEGFE